jgi:hypothetical protein
VRVVHAVTLYLAERGTVNFPLVRPPENAPAGAFVPALYLTFPSAEEASRYQLIPLLANRRVFSCSPAELAHVPYERNSLTRAMAAPFEGAVAM